MIYRIDERSSADYYGSQSFERRYKIPNNLQALAGSYGDSAYEIIAFLADDHILVCQVSVNSLLKERVADNAEDDELRGSESMLMAKSESQSELKFHLHRSKGPKKGSLTSTGPVLPSMNLPSEDKVSSTPPTSPNQIFQATTISESKRTGPAPQSMYHEATQPQSQPSRLAFEQSKPTPPVSFTNVEWKPGADQLLRQKQPTYFSQQPTPPVSTKKASSDIMKLMNRFAAPSEVTHILPRTRAVQPPKLEDRSKSSLLVASQHSSDSQQQQHHGPAELPPQKSVVHDQRREEHPQTSIDQPLKRLQQPRTSQQHSAPQSFSHLSSPQQQTLFKHQLQHDERFVNQQPANFSHQDPVTGETQIQQTSRYQEQKTPNWMALQQSKSQEVSYHYEPKSTMITESLVPQQQQQQAAYSVEEKWDDLEAEKNIYHPSRSDAHSTSASFRLKPRCDPAAEQQDIAHVSREVDSQINPRVNEDKTPVQESQYLEMLTPADAERRRRSIETPPETFTLRLRGRRQSSCDREPPTEIELSKEDARHRSFTHPYEEVEENELVDRFLAENIKSEFVDLSDGSQPSLRMQLNVDGFDPSQLKLFLQGKNLLTVQAEIHRLDGSTKTVTKKITLPDNVLTDKLSSTVSESGEMIINAPIQFNDSL
ncbi:hypothetical protein ACOME3_007779 [Neoechinorhynchus agilis]